MQMIKGVLEFKSGNLVANSVKVWENKLRCWSDLVVTVAFMSFIEGSDKIDEKLHE